jgi:superfamily II DNA or RNA helicase
VTKTPDEQAWHEVFSEVRLRGGGEPKPPARFVNSELVYTIGVGYGEAGTALRLWLRDRDPEGPREAHSFRLLTAEVPLLPDPTDRRLLVALGASLERSSAARYRTEFPSRHELSPTALPLIIELLCATGRGYLSEIPGHPPSLEAKPLRWIAEPVEGRLVLSDLNAETNQVGLSLGFYRKKQRISAAEEPRFAAGEVLVAADWAGPLANPAALSWLQAFASRHQEDPLLLTADADGGLGELFEMPELLPIDAPPSLGLAFALGEPRPRADLVERSEPLARRRKWTIDLSFVYRGAADAGRAEQPTGPEHVVRWNETRQGFYDAVARLHTRRDRAAERRLIDRLLQLGAVPTRGFGRGDFEVPAAALAAVLNGLVADGWEVRAEGARTRSVGSTRLAVHSGIDWFDLEGFVDYGGQRVALPELLAAGRRGDAFIRLDDGTLGLLPEEWLARQGLVTALATVDGDRLRFLPIHAALVDAFFGETAEIDYDERFRRTVSTFAEASWDALVATDETPHGFVGDLRDYQRHGLAWLRFLEKSGFGGCLADDMGLGKTVQVLAHLVSRPRGGRPSLVVVPKSTLWNWQEEAARFAPGLRVLLYAGPDRARGARAFLDTDQVDVVLTTYGTVRSDLAFFAGRTFDLCVLDESQAIKNANTASAKAVRALKAEHRLALSGTPVENHLGELWSLFEFLNPGLLGKSSLWRTTAGRERHLDPETRERLRRALRPFLLRRTKREVAPELPERTEQTVLCTLEPPQRKLYDQLRDHYRRALLGRVAQQGLDRSRMHVLEALLRLRQAACHPGLLDPTRSLDPSAKFEELLPRLQALREEGEKTLVFSQFTSLLALLRRQLDPHNVPYAYLDGATIDRRAAVDRFQNDPECGLFLVSLKAGGLGLNLTAASYVFLLDPWWNPAVEAQAIDRAHRIGQTQPVFAYRLIAENTVEERILELQQEKRELAEAIFTENAAGLAGIGVAELELLLR